MGKRCCECQQLVDNDEKLSGALYTGLIITGDLGPPLDGWTEIVGAAIHLPLLKILQVGYNRTLKALLRSSGPHLDSIEKLIIISQPLRIVCRSSKYVL